MDRSWHGAKERSDERKETAQGSNGQQDLHPFRQEDRGHAMKLNEEMVSIVGHPIVDGRLQYKLTAEMARIEAKKEVTENECGDDEDHARPAFADGK